MKTCSCGFSNRDDANYCEACGRNFRFKQANENETSSSNSDGKKIDTFYVDSTTNNVRSFSNNKSFVAGTSQASGSNSKITCPHCSSLVDDYRIYCTFCGKIIKQENTKNSIDSQNRQYQRTSQESYHIKSSNKKSQHTGIFIFVVVIVVYLMIMLSVFYG